MANREIRTLAKEKNVRLWRVADKLGMTDGNLSRKLRKELPAKEKAEILQIIEQLTKEDE